MTETPHSTSIYSLGLLWLVRLRWLALGFFMLLALYAGLYLQVRLPLWIVFFFLLTLGLSNAIVQWGWNHWTSRMDVVIPFLLFLDTSLLTLLLYFTGGAHNPFTLLYLLHITVAVLLLSSWWAWVMVLFCTLGFSLLFLSPHMLWNQQGEALCSDMGFHLWGMLVATFVAGSGIIMFSSELKKDLQKKQKTIQDAIQLREQHTRHSGLVTLAAGVAHELSTPLSTIAILSNDLESGLADPSLDQECKRDIRLIREQVERCRLILQRLSHLNNKEAEPIREDWYELADIPFLIEGYFPERQRKRLKIKRKGLSGRVYLSKDLFLQSIGILIQNAMEASRQEQEVHVFIEAGKDEWRCEVKDHGSGIPADIIGRLGEPFYTTKANQQGMGLGIYLVRIFMETVQGRFEILSEEKQGTMARMIFPMTRRESM